VFLSGAALLCDTRQLAVRLSARAGHATGTRRARDDNDAVLVYLGGMVLEDRTVDGRFMCSVLKFAHVPLLKVTCGGCIAARLIIFLLQLIPQD
jgi:hypothetical protein